MCEYCEKYKLTGAGYCLKCGAPLKEDVKEAEEQEFFKHASEDLLENELEKETNIKGEK